MTPVLPTASKWELYDACSSSALLPAVGRSRRPAERGSAGHRYLELVGQVGKAVALAAVPEEWRDACSRLAIPPETDPASYAHEVALELNLATGAATEIGRGQRRKYPPAAPWITYGTADSVGLSPDAVLVGDYKLGYHRVTRAAENLQLLWLAVAASLTYDRPNAVVSLLYLDENGEAHSDSATLDEWDLSAAFRRFRAMAVDFYDRHSAGPARIAPVYNLGDHCKYCPALASCPGQTGLLRSLGEPVPLEINADNAVSLLQRTEAARHGLELIKMALDAYASQHPIDLGDGRVYGPVEIAKRSLDGEKTYATLRRVYGDKVAAAAIEMKATIAGVRDALRPLVTKERKLTHLEREALEVIRADGGLRTFKYTSVKVHKPKAQLDGGEPAYPPETAAEAKGDA